MAEGRHFSTSARPDSPLSRKAAARGLRAVAVALMLAGATVLAWPYVEASFNGASQRVKIGQFEEDVAALREDVDRLADFARAVDEYNAGLDANGQSGLCDAWSYTEPSFDLGTWGLKDGVYGRLRIPGVSIDMPVYLGATEQHLLDGRSAPHADEFAHASPRWHFNGCRAGGTSWIPGQFLLQQHRESGRGGRGPFRQPVGDA